MTKGPQPCMTSAVSPAKTIVPLHREVSKRCEHPHQPCRVQELLQAGADPNSQDEHGLTPLHRAFRPALRYDRNEKQDHIRCCADVLLKHGADPAIADKKGKKPADLAFSSQFDLLFRRLSELPGGKSDYADNKGETIAHKLVRRSNRQLFEPRPGFPDGFLSWFLDHYRELVDRPNLSEAIPMDLALHNRFWRLARELFCAHLSAEGRTREQGADDQATMNYLHFRLRYLIQAFTKEPATAIRFLVSLGADVNHRCQGTEKTPLQEAASRLSYNVMAFCALLECGADCTIRDRSGWALLHDLLLGEGYWWEDGSLVFFDGPEIFRQRDLMQEAFGRVFVKMTDPRSTWLLTDADHIASSNWLVEVHEDYPAFVRLFRETNLNPDFLIPAYRWKDSITRAITAGLIKDGDNDTLAEMLAGLEQSRRRGGSGMI